MEKMISGISFTAESHLWKHYCECDDVIDGEKNSQDDNIVVRCLKRLGLKTDDRNESGCDQDVNKFDRNCCDNSHCYTDDWRRRKRIARITIARRNYIQGFADKKSLITVFFALALLLNLTRSTSGAPMSAGSERHSEMAIDGPASQEDSNRSERSLSPTSAIANALKDPCGSSAQASEMRIFRNTSNSTRTAVISYMFQSVLTKLSYLEIALNLTIGKYYACGGLLPSLPLLTTIASLDELKNMSLIEAYRTEYKTLVHYTALIDNMLKKQQNSPDDCSDLRETGQELTNDFRVFYSHLKETMCNIQYVTVWLNLAVDYTTTTEEVLENVTFYDNHACTRRTTLDCNVMKSTMVFVKSLNTFITWLKE